MDPYIINDCVHGEIKLPGYVTEIINTKEFQRLRNLKQLGVSCFVFKSATHNRAEHCIGTAFLCSRLLDFLEENSQVKIDELHKKCVILGGLLHDIGHGPFSHLWEGVVHQGSDKTWTHENQSKITIEQLIKTNNIELDPERHDFALKLITSLITGDSATWSELLKPSEIFITEIVSNKFCNIDVDKFDYILRDNQKVESVKIKPFAGFLERARIINDVKGTSHIAYCVDDFNLIENLFFNRAYLHMNVYQQSQVAGCEKMVKDICVKAAAGGVKIANLPLTDVHQDLEAFSKLDDSVLIKIQYSEVKHELLDEAKAILSDLNAGRRYKMIWESSDDSHKTIYDDLVKKFGSIFCIVKKSIPSAEVPPNIPLYDQQLTPTSKQSDLRLSFESAMIYCTAFDEVVKVTNFIDSLNNNL